MSARIPDASTLADFKSRVSYASAQSFPHLKTAPLKSAAIVYVGLCYLKELHHEGRIEDGRKQCQTIIDLLKPEEGGKGINCSYFWSDKPDPRDHGFAIERAMNLFLPLQTSVKKRCAVLLSLGSREAKNFMFPGHSESTGKYDLPQDDKWVSQFDWPPVSRTE
ncbi:hypothetical protein [Hyphomonas sp. BRH_c22]|uniref:hypothetical protein n=1 Tax=Hyphomonas sp. BRH_c22 TaxID=1629710 RepID=UPI00261B4488|nr:hypothetical protein [Hyphomonas sp. BRH_c22]